MYRTYSEEFHFLRRVCGLSDNISHYHTTVRPSHKFTAAKISRKYATSKNRTGKQKIVFRQGDAGKPQKEKKRKLHLLEMWCRDVCVWDFLIVLNGFTSGRNVSIPLLDWDVTKFSLLLCMARLESCRLKNSCKTYQILVFDCKLSAHSFWIWSQTITRPILTHSFNSSSFPPPWLLFWIVLHHSVMFQFVSLNET